MKKLPGYVGTASFILQLVIGGLTAGLMFEHGELAWGYALVTVMLSVLLIEFISYLVRKNR